MWKLREAEWHEGVENTGSDSADRAAADHSAEEKGGESGEGEAEKQGDVVRRERGNAERAQRKQQKRNAVEILAVGQRVFRRIKSAGLEEMKRLMQRRVPVPIEDPCVDEWIAGIRHGGAQIPRERPGHRNGEQGEERRRQRGHA